MTILVIGKSGQLARELAILDQSLVFLGRSEIGEINNSLIDRVASLNPSAIINAAAYTAVDNAEIDRDQAILINVALPSILSSVADMLDCPFIHVSSDYVFSGDNSTPYLPTDKRKPVNFYGETKMRAEEEILKNGSKRKCIFRTSWVYSEFGNNFPKTMLRLFSERQELKIVADQIGSPTWARSLAQVCLVAASKKVEGIYHWTDLGVASWYDVAHATHEIAVSIDSRNRGCDLKPTITAEYPTPAKRPNYSVLDKSEALSTFGDINVYHWRENLKMMLEKLL